MYDLSDLPRVRITRFNEFEPTTIQEGVLLLPIALGNVIFLKRTSKNYTENKSFWTSTNVLRINQNYEHGLVLHTKNSHYVLEYLDEATRPTKLLQAKSDQ